MSIQQIELAKLVFDEELYPRTRISSYNVTCIYDALLSGQTMPPIVVEEASNRIADGVHRYRAYCRFYDDPKQKIRVEVKAFENDAALFLESGRLNASHGSRMTTIDRVHFALKAKELGASYKDVALAIHVTESAIKDLLTTRSASVKGGKRKAIKRSISHVHGQPLTDEQWSANSKLSGMPLSFHANQLIILMENNLVDREDDKAIAALFKVQTALDEYLASVKQAA